MKDSKMEDNELLNYNSEHFKDLMHVHYDDGFYEDNNEPYLVAGHYKRRKMTLDSEFEGYYADIMYMLLTGEISIKDILSEKDAAILVAKAKLDKEKKV